MRGKRGNKYLEERVADVTKNKLHILQHKYIMKE
jgi:hypothetical protein